MSTRSSHTTSPAVRILQHGEGLSRSDLISINQDLLRVTWLATRGDNPWHYSESRAGWHKFYSTDGARAEDYERLVLVYVGEELVHYSGARRVKLASGETLIWLHMAMSHPSYSGQGARSVGALCDKEWLDRLPANSWAVVRTPNPRVFHLMRTIARRNSLWNETFYPRMRAGGAALADAQDPASQTLAPAVAAALSPSCTFDEQHSIVRDFLGEYGNVNRLGQPPCRNADVNSFFQQHVRTRPRDGVLVLFKIC